MSFPDITELSNAFVLCTCGQVCTRQCAVCSSPTWEHGACVRQLWAEHASSKAGKAAAQRFNDMIEKGDEPVYKPGDRVSLAEVMQRMPIRGYVAPQQEPTDDDKIEQCIDWMEEQGMPLVPWQANAFRAIMKHQAGGISLDHYRRH